MFKKRKTTAPSFRTPTPHDPISGEYQNLYPEKKPYAVFTLLEDMSTSDAYAEASITDPHQWGPTQIWHTPEIHINIHNLPTSDDSIFLLHGKEGDMGIALWDHNVEWRAISMNQTGLLGGCLNENHPGRGTVFEINPGTWSTSLNKWEYSSGSPVKAIDWRYDVPYPNEGATGLFEARASDTYGKIWECVSLDCTTPGVCGS